MNNKRPHTPSPTGNPPSRTPRKGEGVPSSKRLVDIVRESVKRTDAKGDRIPIKLNPFVARFFDEGGIKNDAGKDPWHLLPWRQVRDVVRVLKHGAEKYRADQWKLVPDARPRYFAAAMRHLTDWWMGERTDKESGLPHLAHAVCSLLFLMWFDLVDYTGRREDKDGHG